MLSLAGVPSFLQLICMLMFMPETPRYSISKGKTKAAFKTLKQIYPDAESERIEAMIEGLKDEMKSC